MAVVASPREVEVGFGGRRHTAGVAAAAATAASSSASGRRSSANQYFSEIFNNYSPQLFSQRVLEASCFSRCAGESRCVGATSPVSEQSCNRATFVQQVLYNCFQGVSFRRKLFLSLRPESRQLLRFEQSCNRATYVRGGTPRRTPRQLYDVLSAPDVTVSVTTQLAFLSRSSEWERSRTPSAWRCKSSAARVSWESDAGQGGCVDWRRLARWST